MKSIVATLILLTAFVANAATPAVTVTGPTIPTTAKKVILDPVAWKGSKDAGTPGSATGIFTQYPVSNPDPVHTPVRSFAANYTSHAGVRWSYTAAVDAVATHFVYDLWVESAKWTNAANLELDINQVAADGKVRILGTQCAGWANVWEYALLNSTGKGWHWVKSTLPCNPMKWTANKWKHIQIQGHFETGNIAVYEAVWVDGVKSAFTNAKGPVGDPLNWAKGHIVLNFQVDSYSASTVPINILANKLTLYRW